MRKTQLRFYAKSFFWVFKSLFRKNESFMFYLHQKKSAHEF